MDSIPSDYDWESTSDSGSELEFLYEGRADSILSSLEESIGKIDDFLSFERGFVHGDIVCSVADPSGQMGKVVNVKMSVDLENIQGKIVKGVDSQKLLKIRSISVGDYVVTGPWVGRVEKILDNVSIVFDDGTKCEVTAADQGKLVPISPLEDSMYPYYPGQRVKIRASAVSKSTGWLCGPWNNQNIGTVSSVTAGLVYVDWLACALLGSNSSFPAPRRLQDAHNLTLLPCFLHENWQLGDWCMLPVTEFRGVEKEMLFDEIGEGFKRRDICSNFEGSFVIVKTKTTVDVLWQDGSCSFGVDSQSIVPINIINAHDFLPGQFVLEKGACEDQLVSGNQKWGIVSTVDSKERTVIVKWSPANDVTGNLVEETVSAYELIEHPEFSYCYGDIVFKNVDQGNKHHLNRDHSPGDYPFSDFLSCIGYVSGFKDGSVEVTWASGIETKVAPNEIFRINKCESPAANPELSEQNAQANVNQETIDVGKQSSGLNEKDFQISDGNYECKSGSSSFFLPESTIRFFTNIAVSIFGSSSTPVPTSVSKDSNLSETFEEKSYDCTEVEPLIQDKVARQSFEEINLKPVTDHVEGSGVEHFKRFEMVGDCSDHHFIDSGSKGLALSQVKRSWLKKVQQEWSVLEKDLPESIYVRIYEKRMDLLQAAIVGAPGTPYQNGLFFFDIYLPPDYPHVPPVVHYRSGGLRVNPNLYESGKICLSLLNTWTGTGNEVWNPESSNILQILLSLQALVLNEKPYFNEAGYDKQLGRAEGEKNSVGYNENAYLMTWKSMLFLIRQPPKHFEALVEEHLRLQSHQILSTCKAYMEGKEVGFPVRCGEVEQKGSSTGFKIMLAKLFPKLVEAFSAKGIDCSEFTEI
ncbi:ubiquitin-conjugating enzyme 23 [Euphorbia peplus]|nr:ubiquitin-conjugating enzyme 23 [Euphorbia peplus]